MSDLTKKQLAACERAFAQEYLEQFDSNEGAIDEADASEWYYKGWEAGYRYRAQEHGGRDAD